MYLFGGFLLERGGIALPPIASRSGRSLFGLLVMRRGRPLERDLLAGSFWPDLPEGRARRRLSQTLWQIQDVVREGLASHLVATADTIAFDTTIPYWLDVEEFDRIFDTLRLSSRDTVLGGTTDVATLRTCVELYRGDLLAGLYDDWVLTEQDYYRQRYLVALSRQVEATKGIGAYEDALACARLLTHHDPLREGAHQEVMRLCFLLGRTSEALQQFERCRSVLAEELGTEPTEPTVELYRRILKERRATISPPEGEERGMPLDTRSQVPFVGREDERRRLIDNLERVLGGRGGVVLVEGEPGIGKSRLALEAADDARWRGFEVSWGSCAPGALRPFAPLVEVLESLSPLRAEQLSEKVRSVWLNQALRLAPHLSEQVLGSSVATRLRPAEELTRMKEALVHTIGALGGLAPHLIIVDDVHWADQDTLDVLTHLGPRLAGYRILLLLLYRSEEGRGDPAVWDVIRDLDRTAGLGRVVLAPLSVFELGEMVKRVLGLARLEPTVAASLYRRTGGNALFALESLLTLRDQGLFEAGRDPAEVLETELTGRSLPVAPQVRSVIETRASLLSGPACAVFEVSAVCGVATDLDVLAAAAELPRLHALDAIDDLLHRGLIREGDDGRYGITHDQVCQVIYQHLDDDRRVELHRRVASGLAKVDGEDPAAIGHHFLEGGIPDRAAHFLFEAGLRAEELHAFETARHHLQRARGAAVQAEWSPKARYRLLGRLEAVLDVLGRRTEQSAVIDGMASLVETSPARQGEIERRRAWLLAHTGSFDGAEKAAHRSVKVERQRGESGALAASLIALGTCLRWSGRPLDAVRHLEAAIGAATDDDQRRAEAHTELASTLVEVQQLAEAFPHLEDARALFEKLGDLQGGAEVSGILARALRQRGDTAGSVAQYQRALKLCQKIGYRHGEGVNLVNLSNLRNLAGQVVDALSGYEKAAQIFAELGNLRGEAMVLVNAAALRHTVLGEDSRALTDAQRAMSHFNAIGDRAREAQCLDVIAGVAQREGRHVEALRLLDQSLRALAGTGNRSLEGQHLRSLALLHLSGGDHQNTLGILDQADQLCVEAGLDDLSVELLSIRGIALLASGQVEGAVAVTSRAVEHLKPGVERAYLVYHRHALAAQAAGLHDEALQAAGEADRLLDTILVGLSDEDRRAALEKVPEHWEIVMAWRRLSPRTIELRLPAVEAPTGRPLSDDELRQVTWTVEHPEDDRASSDIDRRRRRLLRLMAEANAQGAVPSIEQLAVGLGVSAATAGRDLTELRNAGHRLATRGRRI